MNFKIASLLAGATALVFCCNPAHATNAPVAPPQYYTSQGQGQKQEQSLDNYTSVKSSLETDNSNAVNVSGDSVGNSRALGISFPIPVQGVQASIKDCTVAGVQSIGFLFNALSHTTVQVVEVKFCKLKTAMEIARGLGDMDKVKALAELIYEEATK